MLKIVLAQWMNTAFIIYFINSISEAPNEDYINQVREEEFAVVGLLRVAVRLMAFCVVAFVVSRWVVLNVIYVRTVASLVFLVSGVTFLSTAAREDVSRYVFLVFAATYCTSDGTAAVRVRCHTEAACVLAPTCVHYISKHEGAPELHPRPPLSPFGKFLRRIVLLAVVHPNHVAIWSRPIICLLLSATQVHPNNVSNVSPQPDDGQISKILWADAFTQPLVKVLDLPNRFKQYVLAPMAKTQVSF